jgi:phage repressor protein C with HTH and peptisase S24 domain
MSARVVSIREYTPRQGHYSLLIADLPGRGAQTLGILLLDEEQDELHIRIRRDWSALASDEDAEVLEALEEDLGNQAREEGGRAVLQRLLDWTSGAVRVTDQEAVTVRNFERTLNELYRQHVPVEILRFRTHLPKYSLLVAAGPFLSNAEDIEAEEWIETPSDLRLDDDMFVAEIKGHSMEPRIPDGSLCVFRRGVVGSRSGRLVLVRNSELADENKFTVKRYKSEKEVTEEGFVQTRIRLESLNPAYPSWDLDEDTDKYQVLAEFVRVLE